MPLNSQTGLSGSHGASTSQGATGPLALFKDTTQVAAMLADRIDRALDWKTLQRLVALQLGPSSFTLGVVAGMGMNLAKSVYGLLDLVRVLALAEYWETRHGPQARRMVDYLSPTGLVELNVDAALYFQPGLKRRVDAAAEDADGQLRAMIKGVQYAFSHPGEVLKGVSATTQNKFETFKALINEDSLAGNFEAGELFGELLLDLLMVIDLAAGLAKLAAKVPEIAEYAGQLSRLARDVREARALGEAANAASEDLVKVTSVAKPRNVPSQVIKESGATNDQLAKVVSSEKGTRPPPESYLSDDYINEHLAQFDGGVTKFAAKQPAGTVGPPGGTFVMPKSLADELIAKSNGDVAELERLLGLNEGDLGTSPTRIDIAQPVNLRMPSGNEIGANLNWVPGGYTSGGIPEATIDPAQVGTYTTSPVFP